MSLKALVPVALLLTLIVGTLPVGGQNSGFVDPSQQASLETQLGYTPPNSWQKHLQDTRLYWHYDTPTPLDPTQAPYFGAAQGRTFKGYVDYENPEVDIRVGTPVVNPVDHNRGDDKKVYISNNLADEHQAVFETPVDMPFLTDFKGYRVTTAFSATCFDAFDYDPFVTINSQTSPAVYRTRLTVDRLEPDGSGGWRVVDTSSAGGHQPYASITMETEGLHHSQNQHISFSGEWTSGNPAQETGKEIRKGERLRFTYEARGLVPTILFSQDVSPSNCILYFDSAQYPSHVSLTHDGGRLRAWTTTADGQPRTAFPAATSTSPDHRRLLLNVAHASPFATYNKFQKDDAAPGDYQDELFKDTTNSLDDSNKNFVRIKALVSGDTLYDDRVNTDGKPFVEIQRKVSRLDPSLNLIQYEFLYNVNTPDGKYVMEIYSTSTGLSVVPFDLGGKGLEISSLDGLVHSVNPGEVTEFRFLVNNIGAQADTVTATATPPGGNWAASMVNTRVLVGPSGSGEFVLRVTPSPTAIVGDSRAVSVRFASSFANEVPAQTIIATTNIVAGGVAGVDITTIQSRIDIDAGDQIVFGGLQLRNLAPFTDTYVLKLSMPTGLSGWVATANPPAITAPAASIADFSVTIKAPTNAPQGLKFPLEIVAERVGNAAVRDVLNVAVEVVQKAAFDIQLAHESATLRDRGTSCQNGLPGLGCTQNVGFSSPDADFDRNALYRFAITNPGPNPETVRVQFNFRGTDVTSNLLGCTDGSGSPDFWRSNFGNRADVNTATSTGRQPPTQTFTAPPGQTVYKYLTMGWIDFGTNLLGSSCSRASNPSMDVTFISQSDESVRHAFNAKIGITSAGNFVGSNRYLGAAHGVEILPAIPPGSDLEEALEKGTPLGQTQTYFFLVRNTGNEFDTLVVEVPPSQNPGWTHRLFPRQDLSSPLGGSSITCSQSSDRRATCPMGVYDEAWFELRVTPDNSVRLGRTHDSFVSVKSNDEGQITDSLVFSTRAVGTFLFDTDILQPVRQAVAGQTVALPFQIRNLGTANDEYTISIISGDADWKPRLSAGQQVSIPGGHEYGGFVSVTAPVGTVVGAERVFRVQVDSAGGLQAKIMDFKVVVRADQGIVVRSPDGNDQLLVRNQATDVRVEAFSLAGPPDLDVVFSIPQGGLPDGWTVDAASKTAKFVPTPGGFLASTTFKVTAPEDTIGATRAMMSVTATTQEATQAARRSGTGDIALKVNAAVGVELEVLTAMPGAIIPTGDLVYEVAVRNTGLGEDVFDLTHTTVPPGWTVQFDPAQATVGPLGETIVDVRVKAPSNINPKDTMTFIMFATSLTNPANFAQTAINTVVGFNELISSKFGDAQFVGPQETATFVTTIHNNGTLPDEVRIAPVLVTVGTSEVEISAVPDRLELAANQSKSVQLFMKVKNAPTSGGEYVARLDATSLLDPRTVPAKTSQQATVKILEYRAADIDRDGAKEYAVSRDRDSGNGFEAFQESEGSSVRLTAYDASRLLTDKARAKFMVNIANETGVLVPTFRHLVDGDEDGKVDHFLDRTGDGLPNIYWDPDRPWSHDLTIFKDVTADAVPDYFVDVDGDGLLDRVYDTRQGEFIPLLRRDVDGDGTVDYVVDLDRDGEVDNNEPVLYSRSGKLVVVQKIDINGDGRLDEVYDLDGDGIPDAFIPAGSNKAIPLTLRDFNNDGVLDWGYDSDGDGRIDAYYDPQAQKGGNRIDTTGEFLESLSKYWYVSALFALVLVLFVVLVVVTRR